MSAKEVNECCPSRPAQRSPLCQGLIKDQRRRQSTTSLSLTSLTEGFIVPAKVLESLSISLIIKKREKEKGGEVKNFALLNVCDVRL